MLSLPGSSHLAGESQLESNLFLHISLFTRFPDLYELYLSSDPWFLLLFSLFCHNDLYSMAAIANDMSNFGHCFPNINSLVTYIFYTSKGFTSNFNALGRLNKVLLLLNLKWSGPLKHLHPMTKFSTFNWFEEYSDENQSFFVKNHLIRFKSSHTSCRCSGNTFK